MARPKTPGLEGGVTVSCKLSAKVAEKITKKAAKTGESKAAVLRAAIEKGLAAKAAPALCGEGTNGNRRNRHGSR
jgi:hypothetical protein